MSLQKPVLFLIFNRPDTTAQVFEAIRQAKPPRLYVAADGPRKGRAGEVGRVAKAREIALAVDWPCEVRTLFREVNLGCKCAVSTAITWFFTQEEQGIILEDDCLPHPDFFLFCQVLLDRYADDEQVSAITGNNFQNGQRYGDSSYYFSKYNHCWGWASWRRAWHCYQGDLPFWPQWRESDAWRQHAPCKIERRYWTKIFDRVWAGQIDSWAYPWTASLWYLGGLTATPNVNLVTNIGFGHDSTHTSSTDSQLAGMVTGAIGDLTHPLVITQNLVADRYVFDNIFSGKKNQGFFLSLLRFQRKIRGFIYRNFFRSSV